MSRGPTLSKTLTGRPPPRPGRAQGGGAAACVRRVEAIKAAREERREAAAAAREARAADECAHGGAGGAGRARTRRLVEEARAAALAGGAYPASATMRAGEAGASVRVVVRVRPLSRKEAGAAQEQFEVITAPGCDGEAGREVIVHEPRQRVDTSEYIDNLSFGFDGVLGPEHGNAEAYELTVAPLLRPVADEGAHSTIFAYGATGGGKTHTVSSFYESCAADLLSLAGDGGEVLMSAFEIYGSKVFDLLSARKAVRLCDDSKGEAKLLGLSEHRCGNLAAVMSLVRAAAESRQVGVTTANDRSSRSHAVLQLSVAGRRGRLSLVDLAGAERGADNGSADRRTRMEGAEINKSLLALKECVRALAAGGDARSHVPFRGSRLTHVLRESFVSPGSRTVLLACVAPGNRSVEHTLNTLRYAERAGSIQLSGKAGAAEERAQQAAQQQQAARRGLLTPPERERASAPAAADRRAPPSDREPRGKAGSRAVPKILMDGLAREDQNENQRPAHADELLEAHTVFSEVTACVAKEEAALLMAASEGELSGEEYAEMLEVVLDRRERAARALRRVLRRSSCQGA